MRFVKSRRRVFHAPLFDDEGWEMVNGREETVVFFYCVIGNVITQNEKKRNLYKKKKEENVWGKIVEIR